MKQTEMIRHYVSTMVGPLELRVSSKGVRSISFIPHYFPPYLPGNHPIMDMLIEELDLYFMGKLKKFSVPLDPFEGTGFQRLVWDELTRIPYGEIKSYGEIAAAIGHSLAARAVGLANRSNSIPILIPCHRVIRADGSLGGYASGPDIKRRLLELEGVSCELRPRNQRSAGNSCHRATAKTRKAS